jgi:transmembrane sensor
VNRREIERASAKVKANDEAASWLAKLNRGLRDSEGADFQNWLKAPLNRQCVLEMARVWHGPDVIAVLSALYPNSPELLRPQRRLSYTVMLFTAHAAIFIVGIVLIAMMKETPSTFFSHVSDAAYGLRMERPVETYVTGIGEKRDIKLPDQSVITLNTQSRMSVDYSHLARSVSIAYGEASFNVAHDAERPFRVRAGKREFEAIGTKFNVHVLTPDDVELTVAEGRVKVLYAPPQWPESPAKRRENLLYGEITLSALETALVEPGYQAVSTLDAREVEARLAWQRGLIIVNGALLEDVLAEMGRYTRTKFVLTDKALHDLRIGGEFRTGDVEGLLLALRKNFLIDSRRTAPDQIVLRHVAHSASQVL